MAAFITPIQPMTFSAGIEKTSVSASDKQGSSFEGVLNNALKSLENATATSDQDGVNLALGDVDDLAQLQINAMKAQTMLQTAVQLTTRTVNAYKEIMQMQI